MRKIQFIPGLGEKPKEYKSLSKYLEIIDVDWNTGKIKPKIGKVDTLVTFSLGCIFAFDYTVKNKIKNLILCSLTPGVETLKDIKADQVIFLVGEKEKWVLKDVVRVRKTLKCKSSIIVVPRADHKIDKNYQNKLLEVIGGIGQG